MMPRVVFSVALVCFCASLAGASSADEVTDNAKAAFDAGKELFRDGQFAAAATQFQLAYDTKPNWKILYNLGQAYAAAKKYGRAIQALERYMAEGGDDVGVARQEEVLAEVGRLKKLVGYLDVQAPDGAQVRVDGELRGTTPLPRHLMLPAAIEHQVKVVLGGEPLVERVVILTGGEKFTLSAQTAEGPAAAPAAADETGGEAASQPAETGAEESGEAAEFEDDTPPITTIGWATLGVGGALIIGGVITGSMALSLENDLEPVCADNGCPPEKKDDRDKLNTLGPVTDTLLIVGGAAAVTGIVLLVIGADDESDVALVPSGAGASLFGRF